jgi:hypothetical protein
MLTPAITASSTTVRDVIIVGAWPSAGRAATTAAVDTVETNARLLIRAGIGASWFEASSDVDAGRF